MPPRIHETLTLLDAGDNPLDLGDVKAHLKVESDDDDATIKGLMAAALGYADGRDGVLGRALLEQQWRLDREAFTPLLGAAGDYPYGRGDDRWPNTSGFRRWQAIEIPLPPLKSIDSITYIDPAGAAQTLDPSVYRIVAGGGNCAHILQVQGRAWPATAAEPDAVKITFTAGYADAAALAKERRTVMQGMLLLIGLWYENREAALVADRAAAVTLPFAVEALWAPHRLHILGT